MKMQAMYLLVLLIIFPVICWAAPSSLPSEEPLFGSSKEELKPTVEAAVTRKPMPADDLSHLEMGKDTYNVHHSGKDSTESDIAVESEGQEFLVEHGRESDVESSSSTREPDLINRQNGENSIVNEGENTHVEEFTLTPYSVHATSNGNIDVDSKKRKQETVTGVGDSNVDKTAVTFPKDDTPQHSLTTVNKDTQQENNSAEDNIKLKTIFKDTRNSTNPYPLAEVDSGRSNDTNPAAQKEKEKPKMNISVRIDGRNFMEMLAKEYGVQLAPSRSQTRRVFFDVLNPKYDDKPKPEEHKDKMKIGLKVKPNVILPNRLLELDSEEADNLITYPSSQEISNVHNQDNTMPKADSDTVVITDKPNPAEPVGDLVQLIATGLQARNQTQSINTTSKERLDQSNQSIWLPTTAVTQPPVIHTREDIYELNGENNNLITTTASQTNSPGADVTGMPTSTTASTTSAMSNDETTTLAGYEISNYTKNVSNYTDHMPSYTGNISNYADNVSNNADNISTYTNNVFNVTYNAFNETDNDDNKTDVNNAKANLNITRNFIHVNDKNGVVNETAFLNTTSQNLHDEKNITVSPKLSTNSDVTSEYGHSKNNEIETEFDFTEKFAGKIAQNNRVLSSLIRPVVYNKKKSFIDLTVSRNDLQSTLDRLLGQMTKQQQYILALQYKIDKYMSSKTKSPVNKHAPDCDMLHKQQGVNASGVYKIQPRGLQQPIAVYCDMYGGTGWTVIQRRTFGGEINFGKDWDSYRTGFGNPNGDYWLGNENINKMTSSKLYSLRIEMQLRNVDMWKYAEYQEFSIAAADDSYRLTIGNYSGDAGNALHYHNGMVFSTQDRDNDMAPNDNCAVFGGWWYEDCHYGDLNGYMRWSSAYNTYYSVGRSVMKIKPLQ